MDGGNWSESVQAKSQIKLAPEPNRQIQQDDVSQHLCHLNASADLQKQPPPEQCRSAESPHLNSE